MRMLAIARTRRTNARARHFELILLVVRLIWKEHSYLAPSVEEEPDGSGPHEKDQNYDSDFDAAYL